MKRLICMSVRYGLIVLILNPSHIQFVHMYVAAPSLDYVHHFQAHLNATLCMVLTRCGDAAHTIVAVSKQLDSRTVVLL